MRTKGVALPAMRFVLCIVMATALAYTVQGCFHVSDELHGNIALTAVLALALQGTLLAGVAKPRLKVASYAVFAVVAIGMCAASVLFSAQPNPVADVEGNAFAAFVVIVIVNIVVSFITRTHARCILLFAIGSFTCGLVQFLYTTNMLVAAVVFVLCALLAVALQSFFDAASAAGVGSKGLSPKLARKAGLMGVAMALVPCMLACIVVIGVIMPLNPPHATIKLFTIQLAYEEVNLKTGVELDEGAKKSATSSMIDESLAPRTTTDKKEDQYAEQKIENSSDNAQASKDYLSSQYSDVALSSGLEGLQSIALNKEIPWAGIIIGVLAALLVLIFAVPRIVRATRLARIKKLAPAAQVNELYAFFLKRFRMLGLAKPPELSPVEYANYYRERIYPYAGAQEACTFDHLTAMHVEGVFAGRAPQPDELECLYALYRDFYARCAKKLGFLSFNFKHATL